MWPVDEVCRECTPSLQQVPWWFPFLYSCWPWFPVLCKPPRSSDYSRITSCSLVCPLSRWVGSHTEWSFLCLWLSDNRPVSPAFGLQKDIDRFSTACYSSSISWGMCWGGKVWWPGTSCGVGGMRRGCFIAACKSVYIGKHDECDHYRCAQKHLQKFGKK